MSGIKESYEAFARQGARVLALGYKVCQYLYFCTSKASKLSASVLVKQVN